MSHYRRWLCALSSSLTLVGLSGAVFPSKAAEKITVNYGPFARSIAVADLRQYSETGSAPPALASVLSVVGKEERESLLGGLKFKVPLNVVVMDKMLRSPQGDQLLTQIAGATSLPGGVEKLALRSALIVAASSKEGVSALSFLEAYPAQSLKIDIAAVQKLLKSNSVLGGFMGGQFPGGDTPKSPTTPAPGQSDPPAAEPQTPPSEIPESAAPESEDSVPEATGDDSAVPTTPSPDVSDPPAEPKTSPTE